MKTRLVLVGVLGLVVVLLIWNFLFFAPAGDDLDKAEQRQTAAEQTGQGLDKRYSDLQKISVQAPEQKAQLDKLNAAVPPTADLEGFIRSAVDLEQQAGVDWVDIEPTQPAPGPGAASQIKMTIVVSGGFFQVLDYLNRLELLNRLVVVDGIDVTTGANATSSSSGSSSTSPATTAPTTGAPNLTVTLTSRMFTQAPPTASAGTTPGGSNTSNTTPTTTSSTSGSTTPTTATATTGASN